MAVALNRHPRMHTLAGDTYGVDGLEEAAGAVLTLRGVLRAWAMTNRCLSAATACIDGVTDAAVPATL